MRVLSNLEPNKVFYWFEEITKIPHGSGNMEKISEFCEKFAKERKLEYIRDNSNNVIIKKPATSGYENSEPIILQGHLDMVCEKEDDCDIDFLKDSLRLEVDGDFVSAKGTTLGADNGIAVGYMLALLDSSDIAHPALEMLFTVDEEIGLLGAGLVDLSSLKSKKLINMDSEKEGIFTVSCAGGARVECVIPIVREEKEGIIYNITISGLKGGHSGEMIDKNRGNSNILMGRFLNSLMKKEELRIVDISGGLKDNAIPVKTTAIVVCKNDIDKYINEYNDILKNEYRASDSDVFVSFEKKNGKISVADEKSSNNIVFLLTALPNGIQKMSAEIKNLPETSLNLGILVTEEAKVSMSFALRSSVETAKTALVEKLTAITEYAGGYVEISGIYSGWEYNEASELRKTMVEVYKKMYNEEPVIKAIHAGLECGVLCEKIKGLDCISIGPDLLDIHTPMERMSISSVKRIWEFLCEVLKALK